MDRCLSDPKEISMGAHANWGHAPAHRLKIRIRTAFKWVLADSHGEPMTLAHCVDEASGQCEICRACGKAPHISTAGTATVSIFDRKL